MAGGRAGGHGAWRADTGRAGGAGDVEALVATGRRPAAFREQRVEVGGIEMVGAWAAPATVRTGDRVWELEVAVEAGATAPGPPFSAAPGARGRHRVG
jgi:hypothetical protein